MTGEYDWRAIAKERENAIQQRVEQIARAQSESRDDQNRKEQANTERLNAYRAAIKEMHEIARKIEGQLCPAAGKPSLISVLPQTGLDHFVVQLNPSSIPYANTWKQLPSVVIKMGDPFNDGMLYVSSTTASGVAEPIESFKGTYGPPLTFELYGPVTLQEIVSAACKWLVQQVNVK